MDNLTHKIDFAVIFSVSNANPNGDPLNGNLPRQNADGCGEISDVCLKRKIRNRLTDMGESVFLQAEERGGSLRERVNSVPELKAAACGKRADSDTFAKIACEKWIDVRSFGQVFAFKGDSGSVGVRGAVSVGMARSVSPVNIVNTQISGTAGGANLLVMKHRVEFGLYVFNGSMNCKIAEKTGFSDNDAYKIREALKTLFENDCSAARPEGSMRVCRVYWWEHSGKTPAYPSAAVFSSLKITEKDPARKPMSFDDYDIKLETLSGLEPAVYDMM